MGSWEKAKADLNNRSTALAFQTGNVFYEILFAAVNKTTPLANLAYFGFSVVTLMLGTIAMAVSIFLCVQGDRLPKHCHLFWASSISSYKQLIKRCYIGSIISWMSAMIFSSELKFPALKYASAAWSVFGLTVIVSGAIYMRRVRRTLAEGDSCEGTDSIDSATSSDAYLCR